MDGFGDKPGGSSITADQTKALIQQTSQATQMAITNELLQV